MVKKTGLYFMLFIVTFLATLSIDAMAFENRSASSKIVEKLVESANIAKIDYGNETRETYFEEKLKANQKTYEMPNYFYKTEITSSEEASMKVYHFTPDSIESDAIILYLHGGAYINRPMFFHFRFVDKLSEDLNAEAFLPIYPLAPEHTYEDTYEAVMTYYQSLLDDYPDKDIILMGDSAGGSLALGLSQTLNEAGLTQPSQLVMISPWLDVALENPEIDSMQENDPMLDREAAYYIGIKWAGNQSLSHYQISPLYGSLEALPPMTLIQGTYDILYPDTEKFHEKAQAQNIDMNYYVYDKMTHVFPLYPFVKESREAYDLILDTLND